MNLNDTIKMLEYITDARDRESIIGWLKQTQSLKQEVQKLKNDNNNFQTQLKNRDKTINQLSNRIAVLQGKLGYANRVACKKCKQAFEALDIKIREDKHGR
jgi:predicted  nucleic acid-binding Zn-ribbon protein